jgi:hypothetical protein
VVFLKHFPKPAACSTLGLVTCRPYLQDAGQMGKMAELRGDHRGKTTAKRTVLVAVIAARSEP